MNRTITQLLPAATNIQDNDEMEGQVLGESITRKFTGAQVRAKEKGEREAQDDVIEASCGLNANGTLTVPVNSWYLRAIDFLAGCVDRAGATGPLAQNILNALRLLDAAIATMSQTIKYAAVNADVTWTDVVPVGYMLEYVIFEELTGNEVTLDLGTSAGGNQVLLNQVIPANEITVAVVNRLFSFASMQTLYLNDDDPSSGWNGGSVDVYLVMRKIS